MRVYLKNIGILNEANFEISDLTIISGENNTGKTYATYALYGFLRLNSFLKDSPSFYDFSIPSIKKFEENFKVDEFRILINFDKFCDFLEDIAKNINLSYVQNLSNIFTGRNEDYSNSEFIESSIYELIEIFKIDKSKILIFFQNLHNKIEKFDENNIIFDCSSYKSFVQKDKKNINFRFNFIVQVIKYIFDSLYPIAFIISSERTGASMFYKELDVNKNEVLEKIDLMGGKNIDYDTLSKLLIDRYSRYPKPVKDNIYFVRDLEEISKDSSFIIMKQTNLNKEILNISTELFGGKYIVGQEGIEFAPGAKKRITKGKILIQKTSSSVKSLLLLYYLILLKKIIF